MTGPLTGLRVIEICSAISGPFATKLLGDMGATVIKIEPPRTGAADRGRGLPYDLHGNEEFTWRFLNYNTNKESLGLDLKSEAGDRILGELLGTSDVLLENMRPGSMERLGFGWDRLRSMNRSLVYCSIKGYGAEGPYRSWPALDTLIQGISGFATQVGSGTAPGTMQVLIVDMMTGLYAAWGITAALFERELSGQGQRVDVSMLDAAISTLGHQLAEYTGGQHHEGFEPTYDESFAPNGYYSTADGYIALFISDDHWEGFCDAMDQPEWKEPDHPYGTNTSRLERRGTLREDLERVLRDRTTDEWMAYFASHDASVLAAPVNDIEGMITDPQVRAQDAVLSADHPAMGHYFVPNLAPKLSRTPGSIAPAPGRGSATDRILEELGYSEADRAGLRDRGIIE